MKLRVLAVVAFAVLAACGSGSEVIVRASLDGEPVSDLPVRILPYDRQAVLDSLAAAADAPEPGIPPELIDALRSLDAGRVPVKAPGDSGVQSPGAFAERIRAQADSLWEARRAWAARAYRSFDEVAARERSADRPEAADTTGAGGQAVFRVPPGRWWISARYRLAHSELVWNVPVRVEGDSTTVSLTRKNAVEEPSL